MQLLIILIPASYVLIASPDEMGQGDANARISVSNKALITGSTYSAIFNGAGLPSGTSWSVSLGSTMYSSSGGSIVFSPTNGQYMNVSYSVSHVSGYVASAASGTVYLNGMNKIVTVSFTPYTYAVTFTESNLPSGTTWSVTLNGNTISSSTSTMTFSEENGAYDQYGVERKQGMAGEL